MLSTDPVHMNVWGALTLSAEYPSTEHRAMAGIERVSYRIVVTFTLPGVEPPVSGCLRVTKLHRHRRRAGG